MRKKKNNIYISFNITDQATQSRDKQKIINTIEIIIPHAKKVESNSSEEIIYEVETPNSKDNFENRTFLFRLKSVFTQMEEYHPHFTTYVI